MRLHLLLALSVASLLATSTARADNADAPKALENAPGHGPMRPSKVRALFQPQAQLFLEQKEAPAVSKTALRSDSASRLSYKSKD